MKAILSILVILTGFAIEGRSQTMLTVGQVYDFNINDEFHIRYQDAPPNASRCKIIGKHFSALNDTVFYLRHYDNYYSEVNMVPSPHLDYFFDSYDDSIFYTGLNTPIDSLYSNWPVNDTLDNSFADTLYYSSQVCGSLVYEYFGCTNCNFEPDYHNEQFGQGLGMVTSIHQCTVSPEIDDRYYLIYYKKDTLECGTPDTTSMSIAETGKVQGSIFIYPNPASTVIHLSTSLFFNCSISIYNTTGILVKRAEKVTVDQPINVSPLTKGLYFLIIESDQQKYQIVFIKE